MIYRHSRKKHRRRDDSSLSVAANGELGRSRAVITSWTSRQNTSEPEAGLASGSSPRQCTITITVSGVVGHGDRKAQIHVPGTVLVRDWYGTRGRSAPAGTDTGRPPQRKATRKSETVPLQSAILRKS